MTSTSPSSSSHREGDVHVACCCPGFMHDTCPSAAPSGTVTRSSTGPGTAASASESARRGVQLTAPSFLLPDAHISTSLECACIDATYQNAILLPLLNVLEIERCVQRSV